MSPAVRQNRWVRKAQVDVSSQCFAEPCAPPPPAHEEARPQRAAKGPSYILQHYHATGCAGGAFSWRAAMLNPMKGLHLCTEAREYRGTTMRDIEISKEDKRRGGGPRVGPFQESIPGDAWEALPKYDFTTKKRSSAFNERMHVEWENHVDHILSNDGKLPVASVVAKAGFRSCAPCCRDMLALARPTGKTFIMVDLAEDDARGTFHFVTGDNYVPVPKEACTPQEVLSLKHLVMNAQAGVYASSQAVHEAVMQLNVPVDEAAQAFYLSDRALLPKNSASELSGQALIEVLHAEHFARLPAEYGASILRDVSATGKQKAAVQQCRGRAQQMLIDAWRPHLPGDVNLEAYAAEAVTPMLPEEPHRYAQARRSLRAQRPAVPQLSAARMEAIDEGVSTYGPRVQVRVSTGRWVKKDKKLLTEDDGASVTTAAPDDAASQLSEFDETIGF